MQMFVFFQQNGTGVTSQSMKLYLLIKQKKSIKDFGINYGKSIGVFYQYSSFNSTKYDTTKTD